jgi:hypothetical protein
MRGKLLLISLLLLCSPLAATHSLANEKTALPLANNKTITVEWIDLLPEEDLRLLESIPQIDHESLSDAELAQDTAPDGLKPATNSSALNSSAFEDQVANAISQARQETNSNGSSRSWRDALTSTKVRSEFNNKRIRLAGYIVPIEYNEQQAVTEFFLVPYFGACIHVPPPPPNQIIYVKYPKGFQLQDLYIPFWAEGTVVLETQENDLGVSSYSMRDVTLTEYKEEAEAESEYLN